MNKKKGGVSQPLFYCIFHGFESSTGYTVEHNVDMKLYLENTIAALIYDKEVGKSSFIAGILFKTSYESSDKEFGEMLHSYVLNNKHIIEALSHERNIGAIFSKVAVKGSEPLSESEITHFLYTMMVRYIEIPKV